MSDDWNPTPTEDADGRPETTELLGSEVGPDEEAVLTRLEADMTAVEQAIESLDRVTAEGLGGEAAAARIDVAVSPERFAISD